MHSQAVAKAIQQLDTARTNVRKVRNRQVRGTDDRAALQATALAWFHTHRKVVQADADPSLLAAVDDPYHAILAAADRNTSKSIYLDAMAHAKAALIELRSHLVVVNVAADAAPDFSTLTDAEMRAILERRWIECTKCVGVKAHLAAIVMMGGLLEALFVARANQLTDKAVLFRAPSVPIDASTKKALSLDKWMLDSYLKVGHEVGWITKSARDLAKVLGEFRNYVHPAKEHRHRISLDEQDSAILWDVTKNLVAQLLNSVGK
jgi:hypothetical protein